MGGYLRDLAFAQWSQPEGVRRKRAAAAILSLDRALTDLLGPNGALPLNPGIGPPFDARDTNSLRPTASPTVEQAIERSARRARYPAKTGASATFLRRGGAAT